jgi:hypothetical protein
VTLVVGIMVVRRARDNRSCRDIMLSAGGKKEREYCD